MRRHREYHIPRQHPQQRLILGIFIVIIGVLSLLDNLGWFDTRQILSFWPVVFIILGVMKLSRPAARSGSVVGLCFLAAGTILILQNCGLLVFHWHDWWPVFIIAAGASFIFRGIKMERPAILSGDVVSDVKNNVSVNILAIMSSSKSSHNASDFQGGEITAVMGSVELDLRAAQLNSEATLHLTTVFGSIEIMVPNDWIVVIHGSPVLGAIEDRSVPPLNATKRLIISGSVVMGSVEIRN